MAARTARAALLLTSLTGVAPAQAMVLGGSYPPAAMGVGDVTGDGRADYATSASGLWTVHDGATGAVVPALTRPWGNGDRLLGVGDVDGDGHDDVCHFTISGLLNTVLSGADGSVLLTQGNALVSGGTDFDGDGLSDLLLTSYGSPGTRSWIRSSRTGASLFSQAWHLATVEGHELTVLGDENGDGFGDVALFTYWSWPPEAHLTAAIRGPGGTPAAIGVWQGEPCGDVDGDGRADIAVSASPTQGGTPRVLAGGSHAVLWSQPWVARLHGLGDVDGDGYADVGGTGLVNFVLSGPTGMPLPGAAPAGAPIALGDVDGDGRVEARDGTTGFEWIDPALPIASRMLRRGAPGTTDSGRRPTIVTRGHCGLGRTVWFDVRGCEPDSLVAFAIGDSADVDLAPLGAPGNRSYTTLRDVRALVADGHGVALLTAVMPTTPSLLGATSSVQAATFDAAANALGLVTSNAIDLETRN